MVKHTQTIWRLKANKLIEFDCFVGLVLKGITLWHFPFVAIPNSWFTFLGDWGRDYDLATWSRYSSALSKRKRDEKIGIMGQAIVIRFLNSFLILWVTQP